MAKKYHNIGSMKTKQEKDADGKPQYYIQIDKKYLDKIKIDGKPITEFITVERPTAKYDRMLKSGKIEPVEYEEKTSQFADDGKLSFVKFDLQMTTEE